MTVLAQEAVQEAGVLEVADGDKAVLRSALEALAMRAPAEVDDPAWVAAAATAWDEFPAPVRSGLRRFRRHSGRQGVLLVRNLPVGEPDLPDTPMIGGSVQRPATVAAGLLVAVATGLGDPIAYLPEKSGALVQDVVPVPGMEEFQGNQGSVLLSFHNENAFHDHRPDFVMLLCLRSDHEGRAGLRTACIREVLGALSPESRAALFSPEFETAAPPSFGTGGGTAPRHAVLTGDDSDPDMRVDLAATKGCTERAQAALAELAVLFDRLAHTTFLRPGDLAIVDNRITVHGRSAFTPRYDGRDRWLQRTFISTDVRRSRAMRPDDGAVLTS